jgi:putative membrane protein
MYLLTGLVLGSIPSILKTNRKFININFYNIVFLLIGILVPFMLTKNQESYNFFYNSLIIFKQSGLTLKICLILFFSGIISGSAMILPGISGSLMLVIFGQYDMVMYLLKNIVIVPLIFLSAGAAAGIFFCSKCVNFLLEKKPSITLFFILGLVIGSCYSIFPGIPKNFISFLKSIFIIFTGIAVSIFLHFVDFKKQT